jgi:phosphatidylglycerophosphate synthase
MLRQWKKASKAGCVFDPTFSCDCLAVVNLFLFLYVHTDLPTPNMPCHLIGICLTATAALAGMLGGLFGAAIIN